METSKFSDVLFNLLMAFLGMYVAYYIIIPLLFPKKTGCGCNKRRESFEKFDEQKLSPADKACVAVGLCISDSPIPPPIVNNWKENIIKNANKIFIEKKSTSKKPTSRKGKK